MQGGKVDALPLSISRERVVLYGGALVFLGFAMPLFVRYVLNFDLAGRNWQNFQSAGATVGTHDLLDPRLHATWQVAHQLPVSVFAYPPGVAWLYLPSAHLSLTDGVLINAVIVLAACALSSLLAARTYNVSLWFALIAVFAWHPALDSIQTGETGAVVMLLAFFAVWGLVRGRSLSAGVAVGLMLFKPSIAFAFVALLVVRRQWRALIPTVAIGFAWYIAGTFATQLDWTWPLRYVQVLQGYFADDFGRYSIVAMSLPAILMRFGLPAFFAWASGGLVFLTALPALRSLSTLETSSVAGLLAIAVTPHAWGYDGALVLPALFFAMTSVREPPRTPIVIAAYLIAATYIVVTIHFLLNPLAVVVIGGAVYWVIEATLRIRRLEREAV